MSKLLKVLYISPNGYLGGAERAVLDFCLGHQNSKVVAASILFFNSGIAYTEAQELKLNCFLLKQKFKLSSPLKLFKALIEIRRIVKTDDIKVIHSTMPYAHIVTTLATLFLPNVKRVWFQHGPVGGLLDKIASLLPIDSILYNSDFTKKEHIKSAIRIPPESNQYIINLPIIQKTISNEILNELELKHNTKEKIIFLQIGRVCSWKGQHLAIQAFKKLNIPNLKLLIVGSPNRQSDKEYYEHLKSLAGPSIEFVEHTKNPQAYMRLADALLHTSTTLEPFGLVVAEAMLNECFVIGSDAGGVSDILIDGQTGHTFCTTSPTAVADLTNKMATFIKEMQEHPSNISFIKKSAFTRISSHYNSQNSNKALEDIYLSF